MKETLKLWLNGDRHYNAGLILLANADPQNPHITFLRKKENPEKLTSLIRACYHALKGKVETSAPAATKINYTTSRPETADRDFELFATANETYKLCMNKRAELFAMCRNGINDGNKDKKELAHQVVILYQKASREYAQAKYEQIHGKLPEQKQETEYEVPDALVKATLDRLRNNRTKLKGRQATPERLQKIAEYDNHIETLEKRWHLLKPVA